MTVDGVQPSVVENPTPITKTTLQKEAIEPTIKSEMSNKRKPNAEPGKSKQKLRTREKVQLKEVTTHELSVVSVTPSVLRHLLTVTLQSHQMHL